MSDENAYRDLLVSMRDRVLPEVLNPDTPARDIASLTQRLLEIAEEIEAIDALAGVEAARAARATKRELLISMRTRVATVVTSTATPARELAALTRRLLEIAKRIEDIDSACDTSADSIAAAAEMPDEPFDGLTT